MQDFAEQTHKIILSVTTYLLALLCGRVCFYRDGMWYVITETEPPQSTAHKQ